MVQNTARPAAQARRSAWPPLLHRVVCTIKRRALIERGQHVLVAVSGGPDSVTLLLLLHRLSASWRLNLTAAHFNYNLRGSESEDDEAFVIALCRELSIPLHVRRLSLGGRARGDSIQAAARRLRYIALEDLARECGADRISMGHTADDQAETVLMWIVRGSGLAGLSGMPPSRQGVVVRPLYDVSRQDILEYLRGEGRPYRKDSSNTKPLYLRNRIRHELLPVLRRIAPASVSALCRLAELCRSDEGYLDNVVAELCAGELRRDRNGVWSLGKRFLRALPEPLQRRVVREALRRCDVLQRSPSLAAVDRVLTCSVKRTVEADLKGVGLVVTRDLIRLFPEGRSKQSCLDPLQPKVLAVPSTVTWKTTGLQVQAQVISEEQALKSLLGHKQSIVLDADRVSSPLMVRAWRPGDRFCPLGLKGRSKKLQDFFTDLKVPMEERATIPILTAPEGIVWVIGYRQDERFAVRDSTRHRVMVSAVNQQAMVEVGLG